MKLASTRAGRGHLVVLVHGWGLGPRAWDPVLSLLVERFTVQVVALPGYGDSAVPGGGEYDLEDLSDAVAGSLTESPTAVTLCGWSLGAMVAMVVAARHPLLVRRLVLVGANARFTLNEAWQDALPEERLDEFLEALHRDPKALLQQFSILVHHGDSAARRAIRAMASCLAAGLPADVATLHSGLELLRRADVSKVAPSVAQPTLLLHGAADPLMPLTGARRLAALLPNAELDVCANAAHAPFASSPAHFAERVIGFVGHTS